MSTETKEEVIRCISCPACGNQYEKDNDEFYFKDVVRFRRKAKKAKSQLAKLTRERDESQALIAEFGDKVADMFEQMERGNWVDDHGHNVKMNAAMCALIEPVKKAIALRAALAMGKEK